MMRAGAALERLSQQWGGEGEPLWVCAHTYEDQAGRWWSVAVFNGGQMRSVSRARSLREAIREASELDREELATLLEQARLMERPEPSPVPDWVRV